MIDHDLQTQVKVFHFLFPRLTIFAAHDFPSYFTFDQQNFWTTSLINTIMLQGTVPMVFVAMVSGPSIPDRALMYLLIAKPQFLLNIPVAEKVWLYDMASSPAFS